MGFEFKKNTKNSLKDFAYEEIKQAIIKGELRPGDYLRENDIATQMGISRGPIREALRQLDQEGLTYSHPYRGTVVLEISEKETEEIFVPTRRLIETFVALNAYKVLTDEDYDTLRVIISKMKDASNKDNLDILTDLDIQFHTYLVEHASNPSLCALWNNIISRIHSRLLYQGIKHLDIDTVVKEHLEYLEYIRTNNTQMIKQHLLTHIH